MRKALIVGINHYSNGGNLYGCVNDAQSVYDCLERDENGDKNFDCLLLTSLDDTSVLTRAELKDNVEELFKSDSDVVLFYFAGHGHIENTGGYLLASDSRRGDEGLALNDILTLANESPAKNKIIVLDSCHSGIAGNPPTNRNMAALANGVTILTASTKDQYAQEVNGSGVFTALFVDALLGGAANLKGEITPGSVYAHIDQSLGAWDQRPVFKTNVKEFVSLRLVNPPISKINLRKIVEYFPIKNFHFQLNPTFEPEMKGRDEGMPDPIKENTLIFSILQKYNRLNLLVPVDAPHMWNAAMGSKSCKLTTLGEHYRNLVLNDRI